MNLLETVVIPIESSNDLQKCIDSAKSDGELLIAADHALVRDGEVIGTFATVPLQVFWMHSKKSKTVDSLSMFQSMDTLMRDKQDLPYFISCDKSSPFMNILEKRFDKLLGIDPESGWNLYMKS